MIMNYERRCGMNTEKPGQRKVNWDRQLKLIPGYIVLIIATMFTFFLIGWVLCASFSTTRDIYAGQATKFPTGLHFENYAHAWITSNVSQFFLNSAVYSVISCALIIAIAAPASYILARAEFRLNKPIQTIFAMSMGVPAIMIILPLFRIVSGLGLLGDVVRNRMLLIFLYVGTNIPYTVIYLYSYFRNISRSYEEAAEIDGCTPTRAFWQILLPMAQSGVASVTIFNFINVWNEYFISLIFGNKDQLKSVAVGIFGLMNTMKYTGDWGGMFAAVIIVFLPTLVMYLFLSKKIIAAITGGLKG